MPIEIRHTDEELMYQVSKDSERAFNELYDRFWEKLFAIAYNRLKDLQVAEDVVQDVFTSLWNNRRALEAVSLNNYLAAAVKYMTLAHFRKQEYARKFTLETAFRQTTETPTETVIHYRGVLKLVNEEVNLLPEKCRLIFRCSRQNGMSTKEIARHLHISPKTVDNQLNKALHHLRLKMKHLLFGLLSFLF